MKMQEVEARKNSLKSIIKKMRLMEAAGLEDLGKGEKKDAPSPKGSSKESEFIEPDYEESEAMEADEDDKDDADDFEKQKADFMKGSRQKIGANSRGIMMDIGPSQSTAPKRGPGRPRKEAVATNGDNKR